MRSSVFNTTTSIIASPSCFVISTFAVMFFSTAPAFARPGAEFHPLGFLNPDNFGPTIAYGVSADGNTAVGQSVSKIGFEAFRWTMPLGITGMGAFDNPDGFQGSGSRACSSNGSVIVGSSLLPNSLNEDGSPFRWMQATGLVFLGSLGGTDGGVARGVSSDGNVVVGYSSNASFNLEAFRWTPGSGPGTGMVGLGDLAGGVFNSQASAVSGDGSIVIGLASTSGSAYNRSFKWTQATGIQPLGPANFRTIGISRDGAFAAGIDLGRAARVNVASGAETMIPHVAIPGLNTDTDTAWAANSDGSIVVGMMNLSQGNGFFGRAFTWDAQHGTRILLDTLVNAFGLGAQLTGWELNAATSISDDGLTIVGYGFAPSGEQAGWLVKLPHPCIADVAPPANGQVNIDDLLFIINNWAAGAGNPADINHSGAVDIDDLLAVINAWGACP